MPEDTAPQRAVSEKGDGGNQVVYGRNDLIPSVPFFHAANQSRRKSISWRTFGEGWALCG